jgi:hypothetical protein
MCQGNILSSLNNLQVKGPLHDKFNINQKYAFQVDRYSKMRREKDDVKYAGLYYNFEVFHMREKQIPVDSVEIKENVHAFAWEPVGTKFAIIHGDMQSLSVSFYGVKTGQCLNDPTLSLCLKDLFHYWFVSDLKIFDNTLANFSQNLDIFVLF